jgi:hypothetical protein
VKKKKEKKSSLTGKIKGRKDLYYRSACEIVKSLLFEQGRGNLFE